MMNRIYYFTGTGNSLAVAQSVAEALPECELVAITKDTHRTVPSNCECLGFVFPNYSGGPPQMVVDFIKNIELPSQGTAYLFAIATYGAMKGNIIAFVAECFSLRGWQLNYWATIWSYPNAVIFYPMIKAARFFANKSVRKAKRVAKEIFARKEKPSPPPNETAVKRYKDFMKPLPGNDKNYYVSDACISCGICVSICPARNISLGEAGKPIFHHHCECCMACIQHCPKRAIDYEDKTQKRGRYTNPTVSYKEIIRLQKDES
jgi:ferredoxin